MMVKANGDFAAEFKCLKKLIIFSAIPSLVYSMPGGNPPWSFWGNWCRRPASTEGQLLLQAQKGQSQGDCGLTEGEIQSLVTEVVTPQEASSPTKPLQKALVQLGPS